jgi:hypothetical protein
VANLTRLRSSSKVPVEVTRIFLLFSVESLLDIQFFIDRARSEFHTTYIAAVTQFSNMMKLKPIIENQTLAPYVT